jgi:uncharacterized cupin superfamily protein
MDNISESKVVEVLKLSSADMPRTAARIPTDDVVSGTPEASFSLLWANEDKTLFNGYWYCTPGVFHLHHPDETVVILEGRVTVTPDDGDPVDLGPGDMAFFAGGTRVLWEVHQAIRKGFHTYDPSGEILGG